MSTPIIIGLIGLLLAILVGVAILMQTIEKNNKEKRRLEAALKARARNFQQMLEGFPDGFLNKDLKLLVCRCLSEIYSQLHNLNPKVTTYKKNQAVIEQKVQAINKQPDSNNRTRLQDPAQIKEIQQLLQGLYSFIGKLNKSQKLSNDQTTVYAAQVRNLMVQSAIDVLVNGVNDSVAKRKPRLTLHYLHMIIDKLTKENTQGQYNEQLNQFKEQMVVMEKEAITHEELKKEAVEEWDKATEEDDGSWKKNSVYD
ncbi:MAG: hypothetical protein ACJA0N_000224 [Pseudohongiellaceae bacterium]|jgi:hypothetical protein